MIQKLMTLLLLVLAFQVSAANNKRYFTFIDDKGKVQNVYVDLSKVKINKAAKNKLMRYKNLALSDFTKERPGLALPSNAIPTEEEDKRRYYTWVDATGKMQNSYHADKSDIRIQGQDSVLPTGELASDYIDSEVLEGRGYMGEGDSAYYTWTDATGRTHNTQLTAADRAGAFGSPFPQRSNIKYSEGRELIIAKYVEETPEQKTGKSVSLGKALSEVLGSKKIEPRGNKINPNSEEARLAKELVASCCIQLNGFTKLKVGHPVFEELNTFSPRFEFPTGESYYMAFELPVSQHSYGLKIKSFEDKGLFYPSLLFLDENKQPTRLVSDAIYKLHPENWMRYAYVEGTVRISPYKGERYVVILTTEEDTQQTTLDNKPFALNSVSKSKRKGSPFAEHRHAKTGSFEMSIER